MLLPILFGLFFILTISNDYGFLRVSVSSPDLRLTNVSHNVATIIASALNEYATGSSLVLFPELCITGYSCGDLFFQETLLSAAKRGLIEVAKQVNRPGLYVVVGAPIAFEDNIYNCAAFIGEGRILGLVPKQNLPVKKEYGEPRWFSVLDSDFDKDIEIDGNKVPFSCNLIFSDISGRAKIGIEICEDLWVVSPPSSKLALAGCNIILNLSASNELVEKSKNRTLLVQEHSKKTKTIYLYASAGPSESSTDIVFSGDCFICEAGNILSRTKRFSFQTQAISADVDLQLIASERMQSNAFRGSSSMGMRYLPIAFEKPLLLKEGAILKRRVSATPFLPQDPSLENEFFQEILDIQAAGLIKRLLHTKVKGVVIGLSGGIDSAFALITICNAFKKYGFDLKEILAVSMPGFGSSERTQKNSESLAKLMGVDFQVISIVESVRQHFADIEHDEASYNLTYENAQARERTQILMSLANKYSKLVVGTGNLSEIALGWNTFNGDHISMYAINSSVPKTLIFALVKWYLKTVNNNELTGVLADIVETPVSPELLPADQMSDRSTKTEEIIGPYELHDFFMYHLIGFGFVREKIEYLATLAFSNKYSPEYVRSIMDIHLKRFFNAQFKRSCMPDGPKVTSISLSPRADWKMPSDADSYEWGK